MLYKKVINLNFMQNDKVLGNCIGKYHSLTKNFINKFSFELNGQNYSSSKEFTGTMNSVTII